MDASNDIPYFPPYGLLKNAVKLNERKGTVTIPTPVFAMMLRTIFEHIIEPEWYVSQNADVRDAQQKGLLESGLDHYCKSGYFEGRLPRLFEVDEEWYREMYPDVDRGISAGRVATAHNHYNSNGYFEGRFPSPEAEEIAHLWMTVLAGGDTVA